MEVKSAPKLWDGAYSAQERYTQADAAAVVEHARLRGVRVMVEFDMPGHAASWCKGYPEVCPSPDCPQPLNVASNRTFELIDGLLAEIAGSNSSSSNSIRTSASASAVTSATPGVLEMQPRHPGCPAARFRGATGCLAAPHPPSKNNELIGNKSAIPSRIS